MTRARRTVASFFASLLLLPAVPPAVGAAPTESEGHQSVPLTAPPSPQRAGDEPPTLTGSADLEQEITLVGVRFEQDVDDREASAAETTTRYRVLDASGWGDWQQIEETIEVDEGVFATEGMLLVEAQEVQVELSGEVSEAQLEVWSGAATADDVDTVAAVPPAQSGQDLVVASRADWDADESLWDGEPIVHEDTPRLGVTIHHTAGSNSYSPEQVPAILRAIHHYHAVTLDWGDIGYHALVDRYGRVWEGRAGGLERTIQGAHAFGMNRDWFGLSVLGNFETATPPPEALQGLASTSTWVLDQHGIDAYDEVVYTNPGQGWTRTLGAVHGHRDVGVTACPGIYLYQRMDQLRDMIAAEQDAGITAVQRLDGEDRYAVAAQVAKEAAMDGARTAYLAQGTELADALGVGPLASAQEASVLLTRQDSLPNVTAGALTELELDEVVVVGGEISVTGEVVQRLEERGHRVRRIAGEDRYETAALLSEERRWSGGTVYLANGMELADALGGGAAAAHADAPMLLTTPTELHPATAERLSELAPQRVVVLGGASAIEEPVADQVRALLPAAQVDRIGGRNRYETSALVAIDGFASASNAVLASGVAPVDAMVGTQLAARRAAPVLLVRQDCQPNSIGGARDLLGAGLSRLAGGESVLGWSAGGQRC